MYELLPIVDNEQSIDFTRDDAEYFAKWYHIDLSRLSQVELETLLAFKEEGASAAVMLLIRRIMQSQQQ